MKSTTAFDDQFTPDPEAIDECKPMFDSVIEDLMRNGCSIISVDYKKRQIEYTRPVDVQKIEFTVEFKTEKTIPLVIVESPFSGGQEIKITVRKIFLPDGFSSVASKGRICSARHCAGVEADAVAMAKRDLCVKYARAAMHDCLQRGEAPYASHLLYTQPGVLDDDLPDERALGIEAGLQWGAAASKTVVYTDLGVSDGMRQGIERAKQQGRTIEYRSLPAWSD